MTVQDDYEALLEYSQIYYDSARAWWKPNGDPTHLVRLIMPQGGFMEFARAVSAVHFYWEPSASRDARSWTLRKDEGFEGTSAEYLATGSTFITETEPPATEPWAFGHNFSPSIVALEITGPCTLTQRAADLAVLF
jgi:hypothetical protein